jgi:arginine decarboxylase
VKNFKKFWKLGRREFSTECYDINKRAELIIREGNYQYNVHELAKRFDSSVEIFIPFILEQRLANLMKVFATNIKKFGYRGKFTYHFPMKVNQNKECVLPLVAEGAHLEVGSVNELWLVKKLWERQNVNSKLRVLCNGPKTQEYVQRISELRADGLSIVPIIEDINELHLLSKYKGEVGIRLNIQAKIKSRWDKKVDRFGLTAQEILDIGKIKNLKILHYHIGSQIEVEDHIIVALKEAFELYVQLRETNPGLDTLNMGGGFAVFYDKKNNYTIETVVPKIIKNLKDWSKKAGIPAPNIIVEWGRYIAAPAQITVYKIVASKDIPKATASKWYIIDGSFMNDLLDTWAIHQKWQLVAVNKMTAKKRHRVWLAGMSCDSDDRYTASDGYVLLPSLDELDHGEDLYIAILDTGAYQDAFASHHCLLSSPAKVVLQNGIVEIARKRETAEDVGKLFGW